MKPSVLKSVITFFCIILTGCAGTNFVRVTDEVLVPGQTTLEQVSARLGKPYREGVVIKNNQQIKFTTYTYASAGGGAVAKGVTPARNQGFFFYENKLVGYDYTSSYKEDSTNFDSERVSQIKKDESTRSDVVRLFGNAGGKYLYPIIPNKDEEAINYHYSQAKGSAFNLKFYQKLLVVTFNKQGVVTNVEFTESGQR